MRKRTGVKRVGHAGTLDPAATGVLPLALGQARRMLEYLVDTTKSYRARIQLGITTNTYDLEGEVTGTSDPSSIALEAIEDAIARYRGEFQQTPPAFSALKRNGVPLYKLARQGIAVEVEPRKVRLDVLDITSWQPPYLDIHISCSKGFYVRSLAHDIGRDLGVGGALARLVRTRVGMFELAEAVSLQALTADIEAGDWERHLWASDEVVLHWPAAILNDQSVARLIHGQPVSFGEQRHDSGLLARAYSAGGDFVAVMQARAASDWWPSKVLASQD